MAITKYTVVGIGAMKEVEEGFDKDVFGTESDIQIQKWKERN